MASLQGVPGGQLLRADLWGGEAGGTRGPGETFLFAVGGYRTSGGGTARDGKGDGYLAGAVEALEAVEAERFINKMAGSRFEVDGSRGQRPGEGAS